MHLDLEPVGILLSCDIILGFGFFLVTTLKHSVSPGWRCFWGSLRPRSSLSLPRPSVSGVLGGSVQGGWAGTWKVGDGRSHVFSYFVQPPRAATVGRGVQTRDVSGATGLQRGCAALLIDFSPPDRPPNSSSALLRASNMCLLLCSCFKYPKWLLFPCCKLRSSSAELPSCHFRLELSHLHSPLQPPPKLPAFQHLAVNNLGLKTSP